MIKGRLPLPIKSIIDKMENSQVGRRLAHGAFWSFVGTVLSRGLNMAAMIILARILGKVEFGEVGVIQNTMGMVQTIAGFGLGWAATKYVAEFRKKDPDKAGRIISLANLAASCTGAITAIFFYLVAPWLAQHALAAPHLSKPLQISSIFLFVSTLVGTQYGILAGFEAFRAIAKISLWSGIVSVPFIVGGAWFMGVEGAVWGIIAANAANWLLNYRNLKSEVKLAGINLSWRRCWSEHSLLWGFSLPAILGGTAFNVGTWVCSVMLVNRSGGYAEMGYYNAANQMFSLLLFLPGVLGQATIPVLSEQIGANNFERAKKILFYSIKLNLVLIVPVVVLGSIFSPLIMGLYGKDFEVAWLTLVITLIAAGIAAMQAPTTQIITSSGNMWMATIMNISWSIFFILGSFALIDRGSLGLAISRSVAYCIFAFWSYKFALRIISNLSAKHLYESQGEQF